MNKSFRLVALAIFAASAAAFAQVPGTIQYQGRVTSHGTNYTGKGGFKFAIIETAITGNSLWSNDGTSLMGSEPAKAVSVSVADGLFIVGLGDITQPNMLSIPASIFVYQNLQLRIWFNDGPGGYLALSPDQPITSVGFAMMAAGVAPNSISAAQLLDGAVTPGKIAPDAVGGVNLLNQSITGAKIVPNSITSTQLADTILLQRLDLGGPLWNGSLTLNALGASEARGLLVGDAGGSQLNLLFADNSTGAVVSVRSPGAKINLWDALGNHTVQLGTTVGGGELSLFQLDGQTGLLLDGYGTSGAGEIHVMDSAGDTATVEILGAETASTGAELRLRRANGTPTVVLDAENDSEGGPRVELFKGDGTSMMVFAPGGGDASPGGGGLMRIGDFGSNNIAIDDNEILARTNGVVAPLYLNNAPGGIVHAIRLAINTATPATGYSLSVNGKVICEELVVQNSTDWPDYVFAEGYELMPLAELEASIARNKHLPGIPSARDVGDAGIPLGVMQRQMMEKIEELTLYVLRQNKQLETQEAELAKLRARVEAAK